MDIVDIVHSTGYRLSYTAAAVNRCQPRVQEPLGDGTRGQAIRHPSRGSGVRNFGTSEFEKKYLKFLKVKMLRIY